MPMKSITLTIFTLLLSFAAFATIGVIHGDSSLCAGQAVVFTDTTAGGIWHSNDTAVGIIDSSTGAFTAVSAGITTITYTVDTVYATAIITVNAIPTPIFSLSADSMCTGESIVLNDSTPGGGNWSCGPIFTILDSTAHTVYIRGSGSGYDQVTFTDTSGCTASVHIFVNPAPNVITGITTIHAGGTTTLSDFPGGTWGSMDTSIAAVGAATGIVTGISQGSVTIYYETYCGAVVTTVTVLPPVNVPVLNAVNNSINVYPSPATDALNITSATKITQITITNLLGQTVYTHNYNTEQVQVNVATLPTGVYFVRLNGSEVRKFVKE